MITLNGKYNQAKVFTDIIEQSAASQIINLCNQESFKDSKIRIMPDVHAGSGCTVGTTLTITDKVVPNLVGVDIGCGVEVVKLKEKHIELQKLDKLIYDKIPSGFTVRRTPHRYINKINLEDLYCHDKINHMKAALSLGTLGGGNHFIEVDKSDDKDLYILIHSGSRHLGLEVATYYQQEAAKQHPSIPKHLAYCEGDLFTQLHVREQFTTIHNYIDIDKMILRKGAVSANLGEKLIIPINMKEGSLLCIGKGNSDWNYSAPHGAGRLMSRSEAKQNFTVSEFKKQMNGIFTTSVNIGTLDECPMAYKSLNDIVNNIEETVEITEIIKPIYNFKAGKEEE